MNRNLSPSSPGLNTLLPSLYSPLMGGLTQFKDPAQKGDPGCHWFTDSWNFILPWARQWNEQWGCPAVLNTSTLTSENVRYVHKWVPLWALWWTCGIIKEWPILPGECWGPERRQSDTVLLPLPPPTVQADITVLCRKELTTRINTAKAFTTGWIS